LAEPVAIDLVAYPPGREPVARIDTSSRGGLPVALGCRVLAIENVDLNRMAFLRSIELWVSAPALAPDS
jgi:hypothetical protein